MQYTNFPFSSFLESSADFLGANRARFSILFFFLLPRWRTLAFAQLEHLGLKESNQINQKQVQILDNIVTRNLNIAPSVIPLHSRIEAHGSTVLVAQVSTTMLIP